MTEPIVNTLHLVALDESNKPGTDASGGVGSGCLLSVNGRLVLLGVRHVTDNTKRWGLQIAYSQGSGMGMFQIGAPTYFTRLEISARSSTDLDFFVLPLDLPVLPRHQKWEGIDVCSRDEPKRIFTLEDLTDPNEDDSYEFAGLVQPSLLNGPYRHSFFEMVLTAESNLKLENDEGERLRFSLNHPHPGHENYRGTSGAPITNRHGKLVALVMGGCQKTNSIFGFPLKRHLPVIYATLAIESPI